MICKKKEKKEEEEDEARWTAVEFLLFSVGLILNVAKQ